MSSRRTCVFVLWLCVCTSILVLAAETNNGLHKVSSQTRHKLTKPGGLKKFLTMFGIENAEEACVMCQYVTQRLMTLMDGDRSCDKPAAIPAAAPSTTPTAAAAAQPALPPSVLTDLSQNRAPPGPNTMPNPYPPPQYAASQMPAGAPSGYSFNQFPFPPRNAYNVNPYNVNPYMPPRYAATPYPYMAMPYGPYTSQQSPPSTPLGRVMSMPAPMQRPFSPSLQVHPPSSCCPQAPCQGVPLCAPARVRLAARTLGPVTTTSYIGTTVGTPYFKGGLKQYLQGRVPGFGDMGDTVEEVQLPPHTPHPYPQAVHLGIVGPPSLARVPPASMLGTFKGSEVVEADTTNFLQETQQINETKTSNKPSTEATAARIGNTNNSTTLEAAATVAPKPKQAEAPPAMVIPAPSPPSSPPSAPLIDNRVTADVSTVSSDSDSTPNYDTEADTDDDSDVESSSKSDVVEATDSDEDKFSSDVYGDATDVEPTPRTRGERYSYQSSGQGPDWECINRKVTTALNGICRDEMPGSFSIYCEPVLKQKSVLVEAIMQHGYPSDSCRSLRICPGRG